ncbi:cysteine desulfurase [Puteibacter caeruleilacunae]|nr:cysteine desulfurase [Puteibacter caeruleilacunae]
MNEQIYLDYNATTPIDKEVLEEMMPFLSNHFGNPSSSYALGQKTKEAVSNARQQVADLINATPNEIVFTSGGTESNNHAIRGIAFANAQKGKHIITSAIEHPAVIEVCNYLENLGWEISYMPVDQYGAVNPKDVEAAIRKDTTLITIMHANNEVGTIQPLKALSTIAQHYQIAFHTDAAQSLGKIEVDTKELGVDLLTIAGHKLYAPKGIGALYIKEGTKLENLLYGAGQENKLRPGTENVPYIVALGKACEIAMRNLHKSHSHILAMRTMLLEGLQQHVPNNIILNADLDQCLPNTLSVAFEGTNAHELVPLVADQLCISTGSACHENCVNISPVLKAMHVDPIIAAGTLRISTGKYTTEEDIKHAVNIITGAVKSLDQ